MSPFQIGEKPPINFSMRVIATDLDVSDPNFKIKVAIDFVPDFVPDTVRTNPNFSGKRVGEILQFIDYGVINKVIEFIYYDRLNQEEDKGHDYQKAIDIYEIRRIELDKHPTYTDDQKVKLKNLEEDEIRKIVLAQREKTPSAKEKSVSSVRYEQFSRGQVLVSLQTAVNGEKRLPGGR